jgi:hypothetical protein
MAAIKGLASGLEFRSAGWIGREAQEIRWNLISGDPALQNVEPDERVPTICSRESRVQALYLTSFPHWLTYTNLSHPYC